MVETSLYPHIDDFQWLISRMILFEFYHTPVREWFGWFDHSMLNFDQSRLSGSDPPPRALEFGRPHEILLHLLASFSNDTSIEL